MTNFPGVSVIITTRNEEKNVLNCIQSIEIQTYPRDNIELIVVDNNSTDKTKEMAKRFTDKVYNFGPERAAQRNLGIKESKGEYILYLDADMILSRDLIKEAVSLCQNRGFIALYIPEKIRGEGFWIRVRDFERSFYNATCIDAVRFGRRDKFLEIGGFDETLNGPEDWDFDRRINRAGKTGITNSILFHNESGFNLKRYLDKKEYYASSFRQYAEKWGKEDPIVRKQLGFGYRYFGVFMEKGKWKKLLRHPILALSMYFLRIKVGIIFLKEKR